MAFLNEAYAILSDPDKRKDFDERWEAYRATDIEEQFATNIATDFLSAGSVIPSYFESW